MREWSENMKKYIGLALTEKLEETYPNAPSLRQKVYDASMKDNCKGVSQDTVIRATEMAYNEQMTGFVF